MRTFPLRFPHPEETESPLEEQGFLADMHSVFLRQIVRAGREPSKSFRMEFSWSFFCAPLVRFRSFAFIRKSPRDRAARGSSLQRAPRRPPVEVGLWRRKAETRARKLDLKTKQKPVRAACGARLLFSFFSGASLLTG